MIELSKFSSDRKVFAVMQNGLETVLIQTGTGLLIGGLAGVVLASRGVGGRKAWAGLGAGIGLGSAWTRTSMDLEKLLASSKASSAKSS
mmetsp:Transcript_1063/g.2932  ORF Transcript_1063/g.2932 Transcript_1063/m.2932 type:complete len:89 (+) Transcript_1063:40-306(+)